MKRLAPIIFLYYIFFVPTNALAVETIRIAYSSVNPHALLVSMAEKRGLYAKYGLSSTIVYVSGGSTAIQAMVSGDIDLGQLTGAPGVTANLRGADIVYIAMSDDRMGYQLVTRREVRNAADLKGKRIAVSQIGDAPYNYTVGILAKHGLRARDVQWVTVGTDVNGRVAALMSGRVDASMITAIPTCKLNTTITLLMTLGRMCRKIILTFFTPLISASFTKSRSRIASTSPRATRA